MDIEKPDIGVESVAEAEKATDVLSRAGLWKEGFEIVMITPAMSENNISVVEVKSGDVTVFFKVDLDAGIATEWMPLKS